MWRGEHCYFDYCHPPHSSPKSAWLAERRRRARELAGGSKAWRDLTNLEREALLRRVDAVG